MNSLKDITISYSFIPIIGVPDLFQIIVPFEHPDTDLLEIYAKKSTGSDNVLLTDMGVTLMRLSYTVDIDSESSKKYVNAIVTDQGLTEENGTISLNAQTTNLENSINFFIQGVSKIFAISSLSKGVKESIFSELLEDFIFRQTSAFCPEKDYTPVVGNDDYVVNFRYGYPDTKRPIFLFSVSNSYKAREVLSSMLFFMKKEIPFKSAVVYEDIDSPSLTARDRRKLLDISDKQFSSLEAFKENGIGYIGRELQEAS